MPRVMRPVSPRHRGRGTRAGDGRHKTEAGIFALQRPELFKKWRILSPPVGIKEQYRTRPLLMSQMPGHAAKRSDPNAVGQQHCWASSLVGKREIPERPCHLGPGSGRRRGKDAFEGDIPQTCCESEPPVFRRAGYGKCTGVSPVVDFGRIDPCDFRELAGLEIESRRPFQFKRQRLFRNRVPVQEPDGTSWGAD